MITDRALAICVAGIAWGHSGPAMAQTCIHDGPVVTCDDGRRVCYRRLARWHAIQPVAAPERYWQQSSVAVEQGVFVGQGKGVVPLDNPNAPISMAHPYSCLIRCNPIAS